jgi:hypothetical protein
MDWTLPWFHSQRKLWRRLKPRDLVTNLGSAMNVRRREETQSCNSPSQKIEAARRRLEWVLLILLGVTSNPSVAQVPALSYAAIGIPTSLALDKADDVVSRAIIRAGSEGSMTSAKVARDVQMLIADVRQNLHAELTDNWNTLDAQKVDLLRIIDEDLGQFEKAMVKGGLLEEDAFLDINRVLATIPFTSADPVLRSANGTTLIFRQSGFYRVTLHGNVFDGEVSDMTVSLNNKKLLPNEVVISKGVSANELDLDFSAAYLARLFDEEKLTYAAMRLAVIIPNKTWKRWKGDTRAIFPVTLQLLPKHPVQKYSLIALDEEPAVDKNAVLEVWGAIVQVPGCGNHDCNTNMPVCADAPLGSEIITDVDHYDQLLGAWGSFLGDFSKVGERFCRTFHSQHSDSRNVQIKISYHPATSTLVPIDVRLYIVSPDETASHPLPPVSQLAFGESYIAYFDKQMKSFRFAATLFTGETLSASSAAPAPPELILRRSMDAANKEMAVEIKPPF